MTFSSLFKSSKAKLIGILLLVPLIAAVVLRGPSTIYAIELSPDGSRISIVKLNSDGTSPAFEGLLDSKLSEFAMPPGEQAYGGMTYAPDGKSVIFTTRRIDQEISEGHLPVHTVWRKTLDASAIPQKLLVSAPLANLHMLNDGTFVYMEVQEIIKGTGIGKSPISASEWAAYRWTIRRADGSVTLLKPERYAFFPKASLIRDQAVVMTQRVVVNGLVSNQSKLDITVIDGNPDVSNIKKIGDIAVKHVEPRLYCDWAGKICARVMVQPNSSPFTHTLEVFQNDQRCLVDGLHERQEGSSLSRDGKVFATITQRHPRWGFGYRLAIVQINMNGCSMQPRYIDLP